MNHKNYPNRVCQARSSVGTAIHIAHIMGCNEIVLLGIDCCRVDDKRYFWQFQPKQAFRRDRMPVDKFRIIEHNGKRSDDDLVDILSYWETYGEKAQEKIPIYNASPVSVLKVFPKEKLEKLVSRGKTK